MYSRIFPEVPTVLEMKDVMSDHDEPVVIRVPFVPDFDHYARSIRYDDLDDAQQEARHLFEVAAAQLHPACMITQRYITRHMRVKDLPAIEVAGRSFIGKALSVLDDVHRVFPYVCTCGDQMELFDLSSYDFLAPYWLDALKVQALAAARKAMRSYCREHYGIQKPLSLNPGSGNVDIWPIEQLHELFSLMGGLDSVASYTGVYLTESSLMIPNKTIAGILFTSAESDYESCAYCERPNCPSRRVPFETRL